MIMYCPECDKEMTQEDEVRGDQVIGHFYLCSCGVEVDGDVEGDE